MEDDESVRNFMRRVLGGAGYAVLAASSPKAALELLAAHPGTVHLLLADIVLPAMRGYELAGRISRERPIKTIFFSGYAGDVSGLSEAAVECGAFLQKPISPRALLSAVRKVLDGPPPKRVSGG